MFDQESLINNLVKRVNDLENIQSKQEDIINNLTEKLKVGKECSVENEMIEIIKTFKCDECDFESNTDNGLKYKVYSENPRDIQALKRIIRDQIQIIKDDNELLQKVCRTVMARLIKYIGMRNIHKSNSL